MNSGLCQPASPVMRLAKECKDPGSGPTTPFCFGSAVGDTTNVGPLAAWASRSSSERLSLLTASFQLHGSPSGIQICIQLQPLARCIGGGPAPGTMASAGPSLRPAGHNAPSGASGPHCPHQNRGPTNATWRMPYPYVYASAVEHSM